MNRTDLQKQILSVCKNLHSRNLLAAADGNVSYRISDEEILITPSGITKAFMSSDEVAVINLEGKVISGNPSSERAMHLEIYRHCPKAKAVVHAHPPTAIAWSLCHPEDKYLPSDSLPEGILAAGKIPLVPYARPGTKQMGEHLLPFLPQHRLLILARHGAVAWGDDLDEAYRGLERVEHIALILEKAHNFGQPRTLPTSEIEALHQLRKTLGEKIL